jgi:hypothetical protein
MEEKKDSVHPPFIEDGHESLMSSAPTLTTTHFSFNAWQPSHYPERFLLPEGIEAPWVCTRVNS